MTRRFWLQWCAWSVSYIAALGICRSSAADQQAAFDAKPASKPIESDVVKDRVEPVGLNGFVNVDHRIARRRPGEGSLGNGAAGQSVQERRFADAGAAHEHDDEQRPVHLEGVGLAAQVGLAQTYAVRGEFRTAVELARGAVAINPKHVGARLTLARSLIAAGDLAGAEQEIHWLQSHLPPSAPIQVQLGALLLARNDKTAAKAAFTKALTLGPESPEALAGLIGVELTNNRAAALERMEARLQEAPNDKHVWFLAAHLYFELKDYDRAEKALRRTIELDPTNISAFAMLGGLYGARGNLDEARRQFEIWVSQQPRSVAAHTMLAILFEKQGKEGAARKGYEKILELDPNAAIAANNLAFHYVEAGTNLDVALQLAQTAHAQLADEPEFNDTLGWVYYKQGNADNAVQFIQRAIDKDRKKPQFYYHLGMALAKQGEDAKAIAMLKHALELDPKFEHAAEVRRALSDLDQ
jgi:tetratricopeptide (TPR) repeat protein